MIRRRIEAVAWIVGVLALSYWRVSALPYVAKQVAMGVLAAVVVFVWVAYATLRAMRLWRKP